MSQLTGTFRIRRRGAGQDPGPPLALKSGELAVNFNDGWVYLGFGDDGSGNATTIGRVAGMDKFVELTRNQSIAGLKTFLTSPRGPAPTHADDLANKAYVDSAVGNAGGGDMMRATYDSDGDGVVDRAELADAVAWNNVTGKPTEFPPAPHDAALITTGTIDPARLPILPSTVQIVATGTIATLSASQQAEIGDGSLVTTPDGRRWVYTGTGSKTDEASYIVLADITPEWAAVTNKPTTLGGYGITDAQALDATLTALSGLVTEADKVVYATGPDAFATYDFTSFGRQFLALVSASAGRQLLELGTLARQDANSVNITGGTLRNIVIEDATWDGGAF